jgi:hypothetical protein
MIRSRRKGGDARSDPDGSRPRPRRRNARGIRPACESLDGRQLLSTTPVVPAALASLPASVVANAAADLNALNPSAFAQFQSDLAKAESHSHVTQAEVNTLAQDETTLAQAIQSGGLHPVTPMLGNLNLPDVVNGAFRESPSQVARREAPLDKYVTDVPGGAQLVHRTIAQMQRVSLATDAPPSLRIALLSDWQALASDLGPNPDTDLGPGAAHRDPLEVYFNGQIGNFIKS